jgi:general secretion pathway protein K
MVSALQLSAPDRTRNGSVLLVTLWVLLILAILLSSFAFDMHVEAAVTAHARKRLRARVAAEAGAAYASLMLVRSFQANNAEETDEGREAMRLQALRLKNSLSVTIPDLPVGDAKVRVELIPESGRRNVNRMTEDDWELVLAQGQVPLELRTELIDNILDWIDEGDLRRLNGAESDDPFYSDQGYKTKNAPIDTLEELLWIKGFDRRFLYGGAGTQEDEDLTYPGIARLLTTWGDDNRVNINSVSREVLLTLPGVSEEAVEDILILRNGPDGIEGTEDDGFRDTADALAQIGILDPAFQERVGTEGRRFVRMVSIADAEGVRAGIWAILAVESDKALPVYWREEPIP